MKLSIVNYANNISPKMKTTVTSEDEAILARAREVSSEMNLGRGAMIVSEVLHTDLTNLNNRSYKSKGMQEAANSFVSPYPTPFLMHHEMGGSGMFGGGDPKLLSIGTNIVANYYKRRVETHAGIASGYVKVGTFIPEIAVINGTRAIDAIQNRLLYALSIGAMVSESNHVCSICGKPFASEECEHRPGQIYEGVKCVSEIYNPIFKEYSAVYSPSDIVAGIRRMDLNESSQDSLLSTQEMQVVDSGVVSSEGLVIYEFGPKVYPSTTAAGNKNEQEESTMPQEGKEGTTPSESTPQSPESAPKQDPTKEAFADNVVAVKAIDALSAQLSKSNDALNLALTTLNAAVSKLGTVETKPEPTDAPAAEPTSQNEEQNGDEKPQPSQEPETDQSSPKEESTKPEEQGAGASSKVEEQVPAASTTTETAPETSTTETTDQPAPTTEDAPAESTTESTEQKTDSQTSTDSPRNLSDILASKRLNALKNAKKGKISGSGRFSGRHF